VKAYLTRIRQVWGLVKPYRGYMVFYCILNCLSTTAPLVQWYFIANMLKGGSIDSGYAALLCIAIFYQAFTHWAQKIVFKTRVAYGPQVRILLFAAEKVHTFPIQDLVGLDSGYIATVLSEGETAINAFMDTVFREAIPLLVKAVVLITVLAVVEWRSAVVITMLSVTYLYVWHRSAQTTSLEMSEHNTECIKITAKFREMIQKVTITRLNGVEESLIAKYAQRIDKACIEGIRLARKQVKAELSHESIPGLGQIAVVGLCAILSAYSSFNAVSFVVVMWLVLSIFETMASFNTIHSELSHKNDEQVEKYFGMLSTKPEPEPSRLEIQNRPVPDGDIRFEHVWFRYYQEGIKWDLQDCTFRIPYGKMTGIIGSSGSGKSTCLRLLMGMYVPERGDIYVGNTRLRDIDQRQWQAHTGVVWQNPYLHLWNDVSVRDNVLFGLNGSASKVTPEMFEHVMDQMNVSEFKDRFGPEGYNAILSGDDFGLSGGQAQRIAMAQVRHRNARLLLLDEPTSGLDPENDRKVNEALRRYIAEQNATCVMIAHKSPSILTSDHLIFLSGGKVVAEGTHKKLLNIDAYSDFLEGKICREFFTPPQREKNS
jgi:ABC-type multidrug transport system, ATPase and permease components